MFGFLDTEPEKAPICRPKSAHRKITKSSDSDDIDCSGGRAGQREIFEECAFHGPAINCWPWCCERGENHAQSLDADLRVTVTASRQTHSVSTSLNLAQRHLAKTHSEKSGDTHCWTRPLAGAVRVKVLRRWCYRSILERRTFCRNRRSVLVVL
jgi:hypothetical protein